MISDSFSVNVGLGFVMAWMLMLAEGSLMTADFGDAWFCHPFPFAAVFDHLFGCIAGLDP